MSSINIRAVLAGCVLVLVAAIAFAALRAAYPRSEAAPLTARTPALHVAEATPAPEARAESGPAVSEAPPPEAMATPAAPLARQVTLPGVTTPCPGDDGITAESGTAGSTTCADAAPTEAPMRIQGGRASLRRGITEVRHDPEHSPVRMLTLGESTW